MQPPQFHQRRLLLPVIHLQAHAVRALDDGADDSFDEPPGVQRHRDALADFELALVFGLLAGWHAKECNCFEDALASVTPGTDTVTCVVVWVRMPECFLRLARSSIWAAC